MKTNSRFTKVAIAAGLVAATGGVVLGVTSFASANNSNVAVVRADSTGNGTTGANSTDATQPDLLAAAASAIGITEDALKTELQAGKSIADVAKANSVDVQKVIDALVALRNAETLDRITQLVNNPGMPQFGRGMGRDGMGRGMGPMISDTVTTLLKLSQDEIRTQLQSGKSLADIAKAQGVSVDKLVDAIVADFKAHLDSEVASGEHTQAEADQKLADFKTRVTDVVNGVAGQGMPFGGPDGDGDHAGMPGDGDGDHGGTPDGTGGSTSGSSYSGTVTN